MEIISTKILRGPNYWSNKRTQLIVLKLDLQHFEELPSNKLPGFTEQLKQTLPSLYNHFCSEKGEGGFFRRLEDGTWLGHIIEHVALELQWLAGMQCGFGRTRSTKVKGVYHVVFAYEIEKVGLYAAEAAFALVNALANQQPYPFVERDVQKLRQIYDEEGYGPSTQSIINEAKERKIPYTRLDDSPLIMLGYGSQQQLVSATITSNTSCIGVDNAANKEQTKLLLGQQFIPVPKGQIVANAKELEAALHEVGYPCVCKPVDGNHGRGITTNIRNHEAAWRAFHAARAVSDKVIIEEFIAGEDYRFLVINQRVIAVAKRTPALVVGNGQATIKELIDLVNEDPNRGEGHEKILTTIKVDESTLSLLQEKGCTLDTVLGQGKKFILKHTANLSTGGTAVDVTAQVHPHTIFLAERIARLMHLDICGIDIVARDISQPLGAHNGAVIEVNSGPGFRMHLAPECGNSRNVAKPVLDMLFPAGSTGRIPLIAVTGTNGKTTTTRLIAHFARMAGKYVGMTTTEGIYIDDKEIYRGDCSGPFSAKAVLRDPKIDYAVLECARGGILREGLGFDHCSISIVTNISEDHLGLDDIHDLDDLARVKSVVPCSTLPEGYAILNADDDRVYAMREGLDCNIALFSISAANMRIKEHCRQGGLAVYIEDGIIIVQRQQEKMPLTTLAAVPLAFAGMAEGMVQNILPAVLAAFISGFDSEDIAVWLNAFYPTAENVPGRMNLYDFNDFHLMIDYGHNEAAFKHLQHYLKNITATRKLGIIAATGDRRPEDIIKVGNYAGEVFDEIIIRHDVDGRGRTNEELTNLLLQGITEASTDAHVTVISNETEALHHVLDGAPPGSFILYFPEDVLAATAYVKQLQAQRIVNPVLN